jgi:hypothetical protein
MLGNILNGLTDAASAEEVLDGLCGSDVMERVRHDAAAEGIAAGALVAAKIRHMLDHAGEDVWLDLLGLMSSAPRPGVTALEAMLARVFPNPVAPRIARRPS